MEVFEETDPSGRYGRYKELLGRGSFKEVYKAFDQEKGIEVAWNKVKLHKFSDQAIDRLYTEVSLLGSLEHSNILSLFAEWKDEGKNTMNFITELCTSGDLWAYRHKNKCKRVSLVIFKNWCKQILKGLNYMHTHDPCIVHRDIKCENIFINGNTGELKIGDFGMATMTQDGSAHTLLGTPEFMAPEIYQNDCTESVDIYAFGMCVLQMVTLELPYSECESWSLREKWRDMYKRVKSGIRPEALERVEDPELKAFIEKCLGRPRDRPSASQLLDDPFFHDLEDDDCSAGFMQQRHSDPDLAQQMEYQCRISSSFDSSVVEDPTEKMTEVLSDC